MTKRALTVFALILLVAGLSGSLMAQQRQHRAGRDVQTSPVPQFSIVAVTIEGTVGTVNLAIGEGFPSFQLYPLDGESDSPIIIELGPYYFLESMGFGVSTDDYVEVTGYPSATREDTLVAMSVKVGETEDAPVYVLRDQIGMPMWTKAQRRTAEQDTNQNDGSQVPKELLEMQGVVTEVGLKPGVGDPEITLDVDGVPYRIIVSPYATLLANNFSIAVDDTLRVIAFESLLREDTYVATEVTKIEEATPATQVTVILRDEDGTPVSVGGDNAGSGSGGPSPDNGKGRPGN